ncbi:hypothetical protein [Oceanicaulis alexandrii]
MFTKRVRVGTVGVGAAKPVYKDVIDWQAVGGAIVIGLIVLAVIGNIAG